MNRQEVAEEVSLCVAKWMFEKDEAIRKGCELKEQATASDNTIFWLMYSEGNALGGRTHWRSGINLKGLRLDQPYAGLYISEETRKAVESLCKKVRPRATPPEPSLAESLDRPVPDDPWLRSAYVEPVKVDRWEHVGRGAEEYMNMDGLKVGFHGSMLGNDKAIARFQMLDELAGSEDVVNKPPSDPCPHQSLADWRRNKAV